MLAYYRNTVLGFRSDTDGEIENLLTRGYERDRYADLKTTQIGVWRRQIAALRALLNHVSLQEFDTSSWGIVIEFPIPRRMGRIDTVLLIGATAVVLEFKFGAVDASALLQVEDYALDLKYFHGPSQDMSVFPIVVGDHLQVRQHHRRAIAEDIEPTRCTSLDELANEIRVIAQTQCGCVRDCDVLEWDRGAYHPVPSVIEAAVGMFQDMQVDDIAHADAEVVNLTRTVTALRDVVSSAAKNQEKVICFVTGVPGGRENACGAQTRA